MSLTRISQHATRRPREWHASGAIALLLWIALIPAAPTHARTLRVERDGSGDYTRLQAAANAAARGDTILVGPGRYAETTLFTWTGLSAQVCMGLRTDNITVIGTDRDLVIVGPTQPDFSQQGPKGIVTGGLVPTLRVQNLTFENLFHGMFLPGRTAFVEHCTFRGCDIGVVGLHTSSLTIADALLVSNHEAIDVASDVGPAGAVDITRCTLRDNVETGISVETAVSASIRDSEFIGARVGVQIDNSPATIERCRFENVTFFGIVAITGADVLIQDNTILGGDAGIEIAFSAHAIARRNLVQGSRFSPLFFSSFGRAEMHGNDFLSSGPWLAYAESYGAPPPITLDLTGNYWGVVDSLEIAARIHDGHDAPLVRAFVEFSPFELRSVPAETESFGGLKARFGPHE